MVSITSPDGTQPAALGAPPYNAPSLFRRSHYLSAMIALCAVSRRPLYIRYDSDRYRCLTEYEVGAIRPKTLAENLGIPLPELAKWLASVIADGYVLKITDPLVYRSAAGGSPPLIVIKASCLAVAWLRSWRQGRAL